MEDIKDLSIIIVGNWNTKIFTPPFIMSELLGLQNDEELEIGFNNNLQPIYKYKEVHFIPTERAFEIRLDKISDESINIANKATLTLISILPFTPNLLVGFNYKMNTDCDFNKINIPPYSDKYELSEIKLSKNESKFILNIILNCGITKTITYNFHYSNLSFINDNSIEEHLNYMKINGN